MQSLFYKFDAHSAIEHQKKQLIEELRYLSEAQLKGTSTEKWEAYFFDKHNINTPTLLQDKIEIDFRDTKIDARNLPDRMFYRESDRPILVDGFTITLTIPFEGDEAIFQCSGNRIYHNTVKAHIKSDHLVLNYNYATHDPDKINADTKRDVNFIDGFLNEMRSGFDSYNNSINGIVKQHLSERIEKFKKDEELKSKLAFPLKPRPNSSQTYTSPVVKKCIRVERPVASKDIITPEPVISDDDYNNILKICHSMTLVMEKSPHAFKTMGEEDIRQHFLVQLNGQYEGSATGETFNFEGKTDILVKDNNRNIFIGECKFWKGPKTVNETIDQLLGYTSWRDTKTAIFLFNRNKNFSDVLSQILSLAQGHPNYLSTSKSQINNETEFRFLFQQKDDKSRKISLTILAFDVPV